ncbi:MAG TPA: FtsX-like permease family protein, partial [Blastocatellia bacterium]|nr:FtsX-like permease family protein [Blastocatellia bacterium]
GLAGAIKEGGRGAGRGVRGRRVRDWLIVGQVAVSFMLLIGAGLMLRSFYKLQQVEPGFNPERVLTMDVSMNWSKYDTNDDYRNFYKHLLEKVKAEPEVISAAVSSTYPLNPKAIMYGPRTLSFRIESMPVEDASLLPTADPRAASPDYFQTMGISLIKGRTFTDGDDEKSPQVALINQSMARHRWGDKDPIGERISFDDGKNWSTIVGVVGDVKQYGLSTDPVDELYVPLAQSPNGGGLLVRTAADPMKLSERLRHLIHEVDPDTAVANVRTLEEVKRASLASPLFTTVLLSLFALISLAITATGIAGVMALSVNQRKHEIGVRMALGAPRGAVLRMVMRQGMRLILIGLLIGLAGAIALTRLMTFLLFEVQPTDLLTYLGVSLVLLVSAAAACFVPARRATMIDPLIVLRTD